MCLRFAPFRCSNDICKETVELNHTRKYSIYASCEDFKKPEIYQGLQTQKEKIIWRVKMLSLYFVTLQRENAQLNM